MAIKIELIGILIDYVQELSASQTVLQPIEFERELAAFHHQLVRNGVACAPG